MSAVVKMLTIAQVQARLGTHPQYTRKLVTEGKAFPGARKSFIEGTDIPRWGVPEPEVEAYLKSHPAGARVGGPREDGRGKYTIYMTPKERQIVTAFLQEKGLPLPLRTNKKMKKK